VSDTIAAALEHGERAQDRREREAYLRGVREGIDVAWRFGVSHNWKFRGDPGWNMPEVYVPAGIACFLLWAGYGRRK
jgi:hypothetical protein